MNKPAKVKKDDNSSLATIYQDMEEKLKQTLGTKVSITAKNGDGAGKIDIEFYSHDDFDRLMEKLMK